jgi:hypothetical protein
MGLWHGGRAAHTTQDANMGGFAHGGLQGQVDFFVSYTSADQAWAEWIAWQLKQAGSSVVLQAWDMIPGRDFVHKMQKATTTAKRTIAVLSPAYSTSQFGEAEWRVAFASDPNGEKRRLVPVRVADFAPEGLLATRIYIDLVAKTTRNYLLHSLKAALAPGSDPRLVQSGQAGGGWMQLLWRRREKSQALGDRRRLGTAFDPHLGQNIGDVNSCRLRADEEGGGDLPVRESAPDQPQNLTLTPRQAQFLGAHQAWQRCFGT